MMSNINIGQKKTDQSVGVKRHHLVVSDKCERASGWRRLTGIKQHKTAATRQVPLRVFP
jgi:hypothetical protein